jgi:hypothetical protein
MTDKQTKDKERDLLDDGENRAVRAFLMLYGSTNSPSIEGMRDHMKFSGFEGCWPEWAATQYGFLTKGGAQNWLRHLFSLEARRPQGREVPEWISIAETKPEIGEDVWLKTNGGSMIKGRLTEDDDYWCDELDEWLGGAGDLFTHWKPIAAAPEGEGRSE